jgi:hypothetical protein
MESHQRNDESSTETAPRDEFEAFEVALRTLSERIRDALGALGWISAPWPKDEG